MYKYFTKNNTYRYLDVINNLLTSYNSVHSTIAMAQSQVSSSNIFSVWRKVYSLRAKIPHGRVKFKVGYLVRITKQNVAFAKGYEQTFSTEIFKVVKVITRVPQPVFELSDLQDPSIEGLFYSYELGKVTVSPETAFQINKIVHTRNKNGIKQHFVKWKGYEETFNSWVNASDIKKI